jgi:hypothetical protein
MNTQTKVTGVLATLLVFGAAPIPSYAVTAERNGSFRPAVQHGTDSSDLLVAAAQRGGGGARGGGRAAGGGNRGGGGAAAANRGGGGAAAANRGGGGTAAANRGAGDRQVRSQATSNVNHRAANTNVNRANANVNRNVNANNVGNRNVNNFNNVNVNGDFDGGWNGGWDDDYHPFAAAAVVGGTAAIVGSLVNSVPPSCVPVVVNGATYSQCGSTWYQPQYAGTSVQYQVVNPPQ